MDPVTALAAAELKIRLWRALRRVLVVVLPVLLIGALSIGVFTSTLFAGDSSGHQENASFGCGVVARPAPVDIGSLDAEQLANAQTIVAVGRALGVASKGWVIALSAALQESTLRNLPYGDRDSIGLFQQRDAWGSRAERLDPATSSEMFFTGGRGGQPGLLSIPDYLNLSVTRAAQAVQVSAFPDAYAKWEGLARQLAGSPSVSGAECAAAVGAGEGSKVVEVALTQLGIPYSWGGGTLNGPGMGFGKGASTVGFDCSSFTRYVWFQATGVTLPRVASDQAAAVTRVPLSQLRAGDLLFFHDPRDRPGFFHHVGLYDGEGNIIHAPTTGRTVEVKPIDLTVARPWGDSVVAGRPAPAS
ncbi:C40 family peptidase [Phycicoccus duodecadis]|uniref:Cell wall-associated NlpC family hydrolase n=1 Tax=Phycicoccus duodecadis TaxID=173053 RepID=A0A2N3YIM6_9MICO|nr:NlpC/P60 family protein [Phycicoccus duodecadis]PKW26690.1 cell wall-associated NlpC family hydrolase [Phycicoccus duodecadis]